MSGPEIVELENFLKDKNTSQSLLDCKKIAETLKKTSCLIVKDPRVPEKYNSEFIDMMEKYYEQPYEIKMKDVRRDLSYQLGATPEFIELPRDHIEKIKSLSEGNEAQIPTGPDPKWRFFWRIGERPTNTQFPELNAAPIIPENFPKWPEVMNRWGELMLQTIETVCEMLAIGLNLPSTIFIELMKYGPHLLAPTGSDIEKYNKIGTVLAGFHYDLNFLTIHGKSRYPGLHIWLRDGTRVLVRVPDGCLLIQAGKQMEWLTGGVITAGFHEVVVTKETIYALEKAKKENKSFWRVSSTLFSHINSDKELKPLYHFETPESLKNYPPILAGIQVEEELKMIKLADNTKATY